MLPILDMTPFPLFACFRKASCSKNTSVKVLRCQLPRENDFYPYEPDEKPQAMVAAADAETQVSNTSNSNGTIASTRTIDACYVSLLILA